MSDMRSSRAFQGVRLKWAVVLSAAAITACGKTEAPVNPNDLPVSHWLNDSDGCTRAAAQAITKSGLPFPNYGTRDVPSAASGAAPARRIKTVDMWLGPTRLVIPAEVAASDGFYPQRHPLRYQGLAGSLPQFYPRGEPGPEIDGMGSMVDVRFVCSMEPKYVESWGKGNKSNADSMAKVRSEYERRLREPPKDSGDVTAHRRDDIGMMELLMHRRTEANRHLFWEAAYWPINGELKGPDGSVSSIACKVRHDPVDRRYGNVGWRCGTGLRLTPHGGAQIEIYVSQIQHMPAVFEQVKQLLVNAQQPGSN